MTRAKTELVPLPWASHNLGGELYSNAYFALGCSTFWIRNGIPSLRGKDLRRTLSVSDGSALGVRVYLHEGRVFFSSPREPRIATVVDDLVQLLRLPAQGSLVETVKRGCRVGFDVYEQLMRLWIPCYIISLEKFSERIALPSDGVIRESLQTQLEDQA